MAKQGFRIFDSDLHIMEPADLWPRYLDPEFRDRAPRGLSEVVRDIRMAGPDGVHWGRVRTAGGGPGRAHRRDEDRYGPFEARGWSAESQLEAMDTEGIDVAVLYPSRGLYALTVPDLDPRLAAALARAYNDWLHDFCRIAPERLLGAGMLSAFRVEDAIAEARRCAGALGFRAIFLRPNEVCGRNWHDPYYDPLWAELAALGLPVGFHEGSSAAIRQIGDQFANGMLRHVVCHPLEQMMAVNSFCAGGVLARHPNLRAGFLEGNCSWLPFLLWRMDEHWEWLGDVAAPDLTEPPSAYFKRQCFASVEADEAPVKYVIEDIGDERLLFSTDFPHGDSKYPRAVDLFLDLPISEPSKRKILWDNCADFYGSPSPGAG
jgi:predicted TIM-barrel fold metal-dependent hydrolase